MRTIILGDPRYVSKKKFSTSMGHQGSIFTMVRKKQHHNMTSGFFDKNHADGM